MVSFDEIKDVCDPKSGGADSNCFPVVCHYFMKLYECFQMRVMVSFDEILPIIMPELKNDIKDD